MKKEANNLRQVDRLCRFFAFSGAELAKIKPSHASVRVLSSRSAPALTFYEV